MVPKGWSSSQLGEIMSFKNGLNFTKTDNGDSVKIVGVGDFKDLSELSSTEHLELISVAGRIRDEELLNNGDLLFVRSNGNKDLIGRCMFFPEVRERLSFSGFTIRGRVINESTLPAYMAIVARSSQFQMQISKASGGTNISNLSQQILNDINLLLPPLIEQKKIAEILSTWDKAISVTEKLLTNSQQQKKALMQQLLTGKKRLLDENGTRFSETWKLYALSELFQRVTTKNNGKSNNVVTISGQHGLIKQEDFFKKTVASDTLDGYFLLKKGQFAYNKSYSNGYPMGAIKRLNRYPEGVVTTLYICFELTTPEKSCGDYWEHYFESGLLNNSLSQIAHEGGRAHGLLNVKPSDFFSLKVAVPGFEEQQKIASVLSAADTEISTLEKKLACLKDEKKALMQQLLTGKRRVKVDEAVAV
ncbi:restriction endonuclease subunit S [Escherichia coli]|uniref:restriction endonuclease subunit S n=1 Tax=Escherichia coli TaxID=562 RepID=UPI0022F11E46|nr:restriction endonuclease subunit S [Escherichia coli]EJC2733811.1 restriction endonuclease subunit S [Escherichia coli]MDA4580950.1 restriction endonuclease subunit S [Escherichia coli]